MFPHSHSYANRLSGIRVVYYLLVVNTALDGPGWREGGSVVLDLSSAHGYNAAGLRISVIIPQKLNPAGQLSSATEWIDWIGATGQEENCGAVGLGPHPPLNNGWELPKRMYCKVRPNCDTFTSTETWRVEMTIYRCTSDPTRWFPFSPTTGWVTFPARINGWLMRKAARGVNQLAMCEVRLRMGFNAGVPGTPMCAGNAPKLRLQVAA